MGFLKWFGHRILGGIFFVAFLFFIGTGIYAVFQDVIVGMIFIVIAIICAGLAGWFRNTKHEGRNE